MWNSDLEIYQNYKECQRLDEDICMTVIFLEVTMSVD